MELLPAAPAPAFDLPGLVWTLVRTDFKVRYHGTIMGFLWALLKPAAMFLVLMIVFSFIFANEPNYRLHLILGLFLWDFFAEATKVGVTSLAAKGYLIGKTRFPRWVIVVTSCANALVTLLVVSVTLLLVLLFTHHLPTFESIALFGACVASLVAMVIGLSLGTSVLFLRYRDLNQIWDVVIQAGFFLAPIVYPLGIIPERYHFYLYVWPPTPVIQFSRQLLVDHQMPTERAFMMLAGVTTVIVGTGIALFRQYAPNAAEHL